jgi:vancomycin resistance protein VanW
MNLSLVRRFLRSVVPLAVRRYLSRLKRARHDKSSGYVFATNRKSKPTPDRIVVAVVSQPLIVAPHLDEKRTNLAKAIALMNGLIIKPGQTLSIWHCLGPPTAQRGWASGRTIINDILTTDPGGGLCQFSSLIYHLGLLAGLTVRERHHHSRDIHVTDATRFTALGLDATIVYGFKDLRLSNSGPDDVVFWFDLTSNVLYGEIVGHIPRAQINLQILQSDFPKWRKVEVYSFTQEAEKRMISQDFYNI